MVLTRLQVAAMAVVAVAVAIMAVAMLRPSSPSTDGRPPGDGATAEATDAPGGPGTYVASVDDARLEVDLSDGDQELVSQAEQLREAVDAAPMTFVVARLDNGGDAPVTVQSVEVVTDTGDVVILEPADEVVRDMRASVPLYDTQTYQLATDLLDAVEGQTAAAPGETATRLLAVPGNVPSIASVTAVGSFGRQQLSLR